MTSAIDTLDENEIVDPSEGPCTEDEARALVREAAEAASHLMEQVSQLHDESTAQAGWERTAGALLERLQDEYAERYGPYPAGATWVPARLGGSAPTLEQADKMDADEAEAKAKAREARKSEG